jgi:hypothetical protein
MALHDSRQYAEKIDPKLPLTKAEKQMFGQNSFRLPLSGWPCEMSRGALLPEVQDRMAMQRIEYDAKRKGAGL